MAKKPPFSPLICTPAYGGVVFVPYAKALVNLCLGLVKHNIPVETFFVVNESLIPRGRNNCVAEFMKRPDATHLIFIDADVGFEPKAVVDMIQADLPIVGGVYPKKTVDYEQMLTLIRDDVSGYVKTPADLRDAGLQYVINLHDSDREANTIRGIDKGGKSFIGVKELPTGFMCIRRDTIEKMQKAYPERRYASDSDELAAHDGMQRYNLFDTGPDPYPKEGTPPEKRRYLSEDWYFCRLAARIGIESWAYPAAKLSHTGNMTFVGDYAKRILRKDG